MAGAALSIPTSSAGPLTGELCGCPASCPKEQALRDARQSAAYWRSMHARAVDREKTLQENLAQLSQQNEQLHSRIRELEAQLSLRARQLYGRKSESQGQGSWEGDDSPPDASRRTRGALRGSRGHGRRGYDHLPVEEVECALAEDQLYCAICGLPIEEFPGTEDSEQVEIEVRAYRRVWRRHRYRRTCCCPDQPGLVSAPAPAKLIPKGRLGISVWVLILIDKYLLQRPTYRLLLEFEIYGLAIAQGTVTDGLQRLAPLFEPIVHGILARNLEEKHWHADETRWLVFVEVDGKKGYRWYLWVFRSPSTVIYRLDPSRSASVVEAHFGTESGGIISADRYSAYKKQVRSGRFQIAFCWAHVRRDFIAVGKDHPEHLGWSEEWLERIGALYACNERRLDPQMAAPAREEAEANLRALVSLMAELRDAELAQETAKAKRKVLKSLSKHWEGLTLFVDHPHIPLDNNEAERLLRNPVVGRKNYSGSGSLWSGQLAANLFSIFQTLRIWAINPRLWLMRYFEECARCGGSPPPDARRFLPWNLGEVERRELGDKAHDSS